MKAIETQYEITSDQMEGWRDELETALHEGLCGLKYDPETDLMIRTEYLPGSRWIEKIVPGEGSDRWVITLGYRLRQTIAMGASTVVAGMVEVPVDQAGHLVLAGIDFTDGLPG